MFDVTSVYAAPDVAHFGNFGGVVEFFEEDFFEDGMSGARDDATGVHMGVAGAGEGEVEDADDLIVFVKDDVTEVKVAMN